MELHPTEPVVIRYVRWKALLFGAFPLAIGFSAVWFGIEALDPQWTADVAFGKWLVKAPIWVRSPLMIITGLFLMLPGVWMLWAGLTNAVVVKADQLSITARTMFGFRRQLPWSSIVEAKRKINQLVLSPVGTDTVSQEIWDRKSVMLDVGTLDAAKGDVEALVRRHRPDLLFRDVKPV